MLGQGWAPQPGLPPCASLGEETTHLLADFSLCYLLLASLPPQPKRRVRAQGCSERGIAPPSLPQPDLLFTRLFKPLLSELGELMR